MEISSFFFLYIHPGFLLERIELSAPVPDSIPTAIFHWEHDCSPLANWGGSAEEGASLYAPRRLTGGETNGRDGRGDA